MDREGQHREVEKIFRAQLDQAAEIRDMGKREVVVHGIMIYQQLIKTRIDEGFYEEPLKRAI